MSGFHWYFVLPDTFPTHQKKLKINNFSVLMDARLFQVIQPLTLRWIQVIL